MITYHLRTPFTLVRRAVRLSHHATPRHGTPGRAEPSRTEPRRATPRCVASRHTPRRLAASPPRREPRHQTTPLPPYPPHPTTPCYRVDRTVPLPPRVGSSRMLRHRPDITPYEFLSLFLRLSSPLSHPVLLSQVRGTPIVASCATVICVDRDSRVPVSW